MKGRNVWQRNLFFYLGLVLAYFKTAEMMTTFAPRSLFGWSNALVSVLWGYLAALLVEGVASYAFTILTDNKRQRHEWVAWIAAIGSLGLSLMFNFLDTAISQNWFTLGGNEDPLALAIRMIVVAVPIVVPFVFALMGIIERDVTGYHEQQPRRQQFSQDEFPSPRPRADMPLGERVGVMSRERGNGSGPVFDQRAEGVGPLERG